MQKQTTTHTKLLSQSALDQLQRELEKDMDALDEQIDEVEKSIKQMTTGKKEKTQT